MTEITIKFVVELSEDTRDFIKEVVSDLSILTHEDYEHEDNDDD